MSDGTHIFTNDVVDLHKRLAAALEALKESLRVSSGKSTAAERRKSRAQMLAAIAKAEGRDA